MELSSRTRWEHWNRLREGVDVLVIGGGITGAGVALDAATRGLVVGLVEAHDFASGTSSRSTKLIHGGIRYIPQLHLSLVREALRERQILMHIAPYLVHPLSFLVPLYEDLQRPLGLPLPAALRPIMPAAVGLGLWMYDVLAGRDDLPPHRHVSVEEARRLVPTLRPEHLRGGYMYADAQTDDVRLTLAVLRTAVRHGAWIVNYARVAGLLEEHGRVRGARVRDELTGEVIEVPAGHVINATGVWAEEIARMTGNAPFSIHHSKGSHLIVRRDRLGLGETALVIPETTDGRLAFVVPWGEYAIVGTTDETYRGDLSRLTVTHEEVDYLLYHVNRFMEVNLTPRDVLGVYAGLRPLISAPGKSSAALSRSHAVIPGPQGFLSIIGGKLTTYRKMAQDTVDLLLRRMGQYRPCRTEEVLLDGSENYAEARQLLEGSARQFEWEPGIVDRLLRAYGDRALLIQAIAVERPRLGRPLIPGVPVLGAEIAFIVRHEMAVRLADVLFIRTPLAILALRELPETVECAAEIMGEELGWSAEETRKQIEEVHMQIQLALGWAPRDT
ncbi:MAG: glycerol-3-phosphate dehydrogenase/oxidase [Armatimonadota bacterium]|nr:glycerol-3-phosphate dehydrogenase/oxidase [Armatimonadota bacterium]MDR5702543.1 glycerol-3-phosphate dehydrogenase/oxidase [Armatimonadota bacterium]